MAAIVNPNMAEINPDDVNKAIEWRNEAFDELKVSFVKFVAKVQDVKLWMDFAVLKTGQPLSLLGDGVLTEMESLGRGNSENLFDLLLRYEYTEERLQRVLAGGELVTEEDR